MTATRSPLPAPGGPYLTALPTASFADLLGRATAIDPDRHAIAGPHAALSHAMLRAQVAHVAGQIASRVARDEAVATLLPYSPRGMVGLLACLASGRTTLVMNLHDPSARSAAMIAAHCPQAVLVDSGPLPHAGGQAVLTVQDLLDRPPVASGPEPHDPGKVAVVHFTSGSTGQPKAIAFTLQSILARHLAGPAFAATDRLMNLSAAHSSTGLATLLGPILSGGTTLVADLASHGATGVLRLMRDRQATCFHAGASILRMLMRLPTATAAFADVEDVLVGAEGISAADVAFWRRTWPASCRLVHRYGSTEAGVIVQWEVPAELPPDRPVPCGRAGPMRRLQVVDQDGVALPPGEVGALVVSGPHMALGEWRAGRLLPGGMVPDPLRPGWSSFHTGDLVRLGEDGLVTFSTRADRQVKINGQRVEPAEIEAVLRGHAGVTDAAVVARTLSGRVALHAFVEAAGAEAGPLRIAVGDRLRHAVAAAMQPASITVLERLPRLPGGKTDYASLAARSAHDHGDDTP